MSRYCYIYSHGVVHIWHLATAYKQSSCQRDFYLAALKAVYIAQVYLGSVELISTSADYSLSVCISDSCAYKCSSCKV